MGLGGFWRSLGAIGLALLPLAAVTCLIAAMARDASEIAGAAAAVGGALSLFACAQLTLLGRETRRLGERQAELRAQALALARCMRVLNARTIPDAAERLADLGEGPPAEGPAPPLLKAAPPADVLAVDPLLALPGHARWGARVRALDHAPARRAPWLSRRSVDALVGDALPGFLGRGEGAQGCLLVVAPLAPSRLPLTLAAMLRAGRADPSLFNRLLFGVPQSTLRDPREARVVGELARAGLRLALVGVEDFQLDPEALAACNFVCVETDATALLAAAGQSSRAFVGLVALGRRCAAAGVAIVCTGVDGPGQAARLGALGVSAAAGSRLAEPVELATIPWRATTVAAPSRGLAGLLRRAG